MLAYSPSFSATDVELGTAPDVLQAGTAVVAWHDRFVRVMVAESASYGYLNSAQRFQKPDAPGLTTTTGKTTTGQTTTGQTTTPQQMTTMPGGTTPTTLLGGAPQNFPFASSDTSGNITFFERRLNVSVGGGYRVGGGLGQSAQPYLPQQFGPRGAIAIGYVASRRDTFSTLAAAQNTITPYGQCFPPSTSPIPTFCRNEAPSAEVLETLRHELSRPASLSLGAGAAAIVTVTEEGQRELAIVPVATAALTEQLDDRGADSLGLAIQLAPLVDIRTGLLSERIQATASLSSRVSRSVIVIATAGLLKSLDTFLADPSPITALTGGVEARIQLSREIDVGMGALAVWQDQPGYAAFGASDQGSETGYVSVTARVPTLHF